MKDDSKNTNSADNPMLPAVVARPTPAWDRLAAYSMRSPYQRWRIKRTPSEAAKLRYPHAARGQVATTSMKVGGYS
jgi:hypothetical protein